MSTNTKSGWNPTKEGSEKESSAHAHGDKWRKDFLEKQTDPRKKFANVKAAPVLKNEYWWTPDPLTGVYVPEYYHGYVTTAPRASRKKASGLGASYERKETDLDQSQGPWFDNMEELPGMERHKKK